MLYALIFCSFLLTALVLGQLFTWLTRRQRVIKERWQTTLAESLPRAPLRESVSRAGKVGQWLKAIPLPSLVISKPYLDKIQTNLNRAGIPLKAEEILSIAFILGLAAFILGMALLRQVSLALIWAALALFAPALWVNYLKQRRLLRFESQLLDAIVLVANSLRAGHSFMQAIELVSRETPPPLSLEFGRVLRENLVGIPVEEALLNLTERVESKDLELVVTGMLIQRQVGGNLAEVLDSIAKTIEKRIKMRAKIRALTAQGRMSAWVVSLLPFALGFFVFGMHPEFGRIMLDESLGIAMLAVGGIMMLLGILLIRRVVNIDV